MIEVEHIVKTYGATIAVNDVSFRVGKGEIVGFLGPNGAGKSTTLKIVTCYIVADEGTVRVDGLDALQHTLEVRRRIGYLPENTPLYPDMQVLEFLEFVGRARQLSGPVLRDAIDRVVSTVGIERMLRKNIGHLSKGYRQRVGLAQALIHDPPILVMDEPTSGLDPHQIIEIRELIRDLGREKAIILSSHILQEVSAVSTRILIIREGRLVADGTPEELQTALEDTKVFECAVRGPEHEVAEALRSLELTRKVEPLAQRDGFVRFRLFAARDAGDLDLGAAVFDLVSRNGWVLAEFHPERRSLEEAYLRLTERRPEAAELRAAS